MKKRINKTFYIFGKTKHLDLYLNRMFYLKLISRVGNGEIDSYMLDRCCGYYIMIIDGFMWKRRFEYKIKRKLMFKLGDIEIY